MVYHPENYDNKSVISPKTNYIIHTYAIFSTRAPIGAWKGVVLEIINHQQTDGHED